MSLRVTVVLEVAQLDDTKLIQIHRGDTSINPDPTDEPAEVLLAERLTERLLTEVMGEAAQRFQEFATALRKVME